MNEFKFPSLPGISNFTMRIISKIGILNKRINALIFFILSIAIYIFIMPGCNTTTSPQQSDCDIGFLPCSGNITECFEVSCSELSHVCGELLTDCCLDTTNHQFSWIIDTLGVYGSYLNDVAVVNENNIWAVGNIRMPDPDSSNGTGYQNFNSVHWNGSEWEFIQIINPDPIMGVLYFDSNDIWMVNGYPIHWDGVEWTLFQLQNYDIQAAVEHLWGSSSSDIYFVGLSGAVVHYNGANFEQLESGTDLKLRSIIGSGDHIWVTGYQDLIGTILLEYRNDAFETVYFRSENFMDFHPDSLSGKTMAVWTNNPDSVNVLTPKGIYRVPRNSHGEGRFIPNYWQGFPWSIGGNSDNDIFSGGDFSSIYHFNGSTFRYYPEFLGRISIQSITMKDDLVCLVGEDYETGKAISIRGTR